MKKQRIALPINHDELAEHFGRCEEFAIFDVENNQITHRISVPTPQHEKNVFPDFLSALDINAVIVAGIGQHAIDRLIAHNIKIHAGIKGTRPKKIVEDYIQGNLKEGLNLCDH